MGVGNRIKRRRKELKYSADYVAEKLGKNRATIYRYESEDIENMPIDVIKDLSVVLETSPAYLMGWSETVDDLSNSSTYDYFNTYVSAGLPEDTDGVHNDKIQIPDVIMGKYAGKKNIFITKVNGESMNNVIADGTLIVVERVELNQLSDGDIVIYKTDNDYAVKRFYRHDNKLIFRPDSSDPSFTDLVIDLNDDNCNVTIKGKVVMHFAELD